MHLTCSVKVTCVTCGSFGAGTGVRVLSVLAGASVSAGLTQALINVGLAQSAGVSRTAVAGERGHAVSTHSVMTRARRTLVHVQLALGACETCGTQTGVNISIPNT